MRTLGELRTWFKYVMFLSAYSPLFLIFLLRLLPHYISTGETSSNANESIFLIADFLHTNGSVIILGLVMVFLTIIIVPNILLIGYIRSLRRTQNPLPVKVASAKGMNQIYIGYLMTYVIPFLSLNYTRLLDILSLVILLGIICIIYINSNLLYVNVFFSLFNYNLFKVLDKNGKEYYVMTKRRQMYDGEVITTAPISDVSEGFLLDVRGSMND